MNPQKQVTFIHTGEVHKANFEALVRKFDPNIGIHHVVNEQMLAEALVTGVPSQEAFEGEIRRAQLSNPDLIICTCSTFGELADQSGVVKRIDRPVVEYMVSGYSQIGLAFSAKSTWVSSSRLIESQAARLNKTVELVPIDCSRYWPDFLEGDSNAYYRGIADQVIKNLGAFEVVFLAQASMSGAQPFLAKKGIEVLTSPPMGVEELLKSLGPT